MSDLAVQSLTLKVLYDVLKICTLTFLHLAGFFAYIAAIHYLVVVTWVVFVDW